jgi:hypothetical protein
MHRALAPSDPIPATAPGKEGLRPKDRSDFYTRKRMKWGMWNGECGTQERQEKPASPASARPSTCPIPLLPLRIFAAYPFRVFRVFRGEKPDRRKRSNFQAFVGPALCAVPAWPRGPSPTVQRLKTESSLRDLRGLRVEHKALLLPLAPCRVSLPLRLPFRVFRVFRGEKPDRIEAHPLWRLPV